MKLFLVLAMIVASGWAGERRLRLVPEQKTSAASPVIEPVISLEEELKLIRVRLDSPYDTEVFRGMRRLEDLGNQADQETLKKFAKKFEDGFLFDKNLFVDTDSPLFARAMPELLEASRHPQRIPQLLMQNRENKAFVNTLLHRIAMGRVEISSRLKPWVAETVRQLLQTEARNSDAEASRVLLSIRAIKSLRVKSDSLVDSLINVFNHPGTMDSQKRYRIFSSAMEILEETGALKKMSAETVTQLYPKLSSYSSLQLKLIENTAGLPESQKLLIEYVGRSDQKFGMKFSDERWVGENRRAWYSLAAQNISDPVMRDEMKRLMVNPYRLFQAIVAAPKLVESLKPEIESSLFMISRALPGVTQERMFFLGGPQAATLDDFVDTVKNGQRPPGPQGLAFQRYTYEEIRKALSPVFYDTLVVNLSASLPKHESDFNRLINTLKVVEELGSDDPRLIQLVSRWTDLAADRYSDNSLHRSLADTIRRKSVHLLAGSHPTDLGLQLRLIQALSDSDQAIRREALEGVSQLKELLPEAKARLRQSLTSNLQSEVKLLAPEIQKRFRRIAGSLEKVTKDYVPTELETASQCDPSKLRSFFDYLLKTKK